jgi:5-methyltetrahydropteroyltriglutamate--homocysteine methyltransferase
VIRSSHVGSFPLRYSPENVERVLADLYSIGLDVPPYPQLRGFVDIHMEPLVRSGAVAEIAGRYVCTSAERLYSWRGEVRAPEVELAVEAVRRRGLAFRAVRAPVAGPFTLASRVYTSVSSTDLSSTLLARRDAVREFFARYVAAWVRYAASLGYTVIFLDEPVLAVLIGARRNLYGYSDDEIAEILDAALGAAPGVDAGVHVCGRVHRRVLEVISRAGRVKYASLEFRDSPQNIGTIDKRLLESHDKIVAPGVVSSRVPRLESLEGALSLLKRVYEAAGGRVDLASADCGFAGLRGALGDPEREYAVALSKLELVVRACRQLGAP